MSEMGSVAFERQVRKKEKSRLEKLAGNPFLNVGIVEHFKNIEEDRVPSSDWDIFDGVTSGELAETSERFLKYRQEIKSYLDKCKQRKENINKDPRHNLEAIMLSWFSAENDFAVQERKKTLIKDVENELTELKNENPAVGQYLDEVVRKYMPKLKKCDLELIRDYGKLSEQYFANFEEKLSDHFGSELIGNDAPKTSDGKVNLIENHPRYHFYKAVCEAKGYVPKKVTDLITL